MVKPKTKRYLAKVAPFAVGTAAVIAATGPVGLVLGSPLLLAGHIFAKTTERTYGV